MNSRPVKMYTNDKTQLRAKCQSPCKWFVYARKIPALQSPDFVVVSVENKHSGCEVPVKNPRLTSRWLSTRYIDRFKANLKMPVKLIRQNVDEDFGVDISRTKGYNARAMASSIIMGDAAQQYGQIWDYVEELRRSHPGSTIDVYFTPFREPGCKPRFMRIYCCLEPLKRGFKYGCRPIIFVDGCFTKGSYPGQVLTAMGVDPNNGWWPIAWAVVEKESTEQWFWFVELLMKDLQIEDSSHYTIMSDQQKGLDKAIAELFPNSEHRYCVNVGRWANKSRARGRGWGRGRS